MKTILIVDDEPKIVDVVSSYLQNAGFQTIEAYTGGEAIQYIKDKRVDLVVLDLMLPDHSGEDICRFIRQELAVPVIMLTAKVKEEERITGLSLGADDYMIKPFSPRELVMRVKTILRRAIPDALLADSIEYNDGKLIIDASTHEVILDGAKVNLTPIEYKTLIVLARHPKRTFSREDLVELVLGFDYAGDTRVIDQHIKNLRHKVENHPKKPEYIHTVFGVGYKFEGNPHES